MFSEYCPVKHLYIPGNRPQHRCKKYVHTNVRLHILAVSDVSFHKSLKPFHPHKKQN